MSQFLYSLLARPHFVRFDAKLRIPADAHITPVLVPLHRFPWMAKELDLHLLELTTAEGVVARVNLVAKGLADLGNSKGKLQPSTVEDIAEVGKDALGRFWPEV